MQLFCVAVLVIINIYKLCSLFSESVGLYIHFGDRLDVVDRCENSHWDKGLKGIDCHSFMYLNRQCIQPAMKINILKQY